jgi:hypothetical protein
LFIVPEYNETFYLSSRNIPNADAVLLSDVNTYEIVNADVLVLTEGAAKIFSEDETVAEGIDVKPKGDKGKLDLKCLVHVSNHQIFKFST